MADNTISKIYDIKNLGAAKALKEIDDINKKYIELKKNKLSLDGLKANIEDPAKLDDINKKLADLLVKEKELEVQMKEKQTQAKEMGLLQQQEALQLAELKRQRAEIQTQQESMRLTRQKEIADQKTLASGNEAIAGSYNDIMKKYRELSAIAKNVIPLNDPVQVKSAQEELYRLKGLIDNFNRGLTGDGTLVGEYTTGIVNAFKRLGLEDVIKDQVKGAKEQLAALETEAKTLSQQLSNIGVSSEGSFELLQTQLIENRTQAEALRVQIAGVEAELDEAGNVGRRMTENISEGFKETAHEIAGFVVAYVGFQGFIEIVHGGIEEFNKMDESVGRFQSRLHNLGKDDDIPELKDQVEQLANEFKFLNENDIRDVFTTLETYGKLSVDQIKELTPVIINFATEQKLSLKDASDEITAALEGQGRGLKKYGINIKDAADVSTRFSLIMEQLGGRVKDAAQEFGEEAPGKLAAAKEEFVKIEEEVGGKLVPIFTKSLNVISGVLSVILTLSGYLPAAIGLATAWTAIWAIANATMIRTKVATLASNVAFTTQYALLVLEETVTKAYAAALTFVTGAQSRAAAGAVFFNEVLAASPIGMILGTIVLLAAAFVALGAAIGGNSSKLQEHSKYLMAEAEVRAKAIESVADEVQKINMLTNVIKDNSASLDIRKRALADLISISPKYLHGLTLENIKTAEGTKAVNDYIDALKRKSAYEASTSIMGDKQKEDARLQGLELSLQLKKDNGIQNRSAMTDAEKDEIPSVFSSLFWSSFNNVDIALANVKRKRSELSGELNALQKVVKEKYVDYAGDIVQPETAKGRSEKDVMTPGELQTWINELEKENSLLKETDPKLKENNALRDRLQKRLDAANGKKENVSGADKLNKDEQNRLKEIDAAKEQLTRNENERYDNLQKTREIDINDEVSHQQALLKILQDAADKKISIIQGSNAAEKKEISDLRDEKAANVKKTNDAIYSAFIADLDRQRDILDLNAQKSFDAVDTDPNANDSEKANAQANLVSSKLSVRKQYWDAVLTLDKLYGKRVKEDTLARDKELEDLQKQSNQAILNSLSSAAQNELTEVQNNYLNKMRVISAALAEKITGIYLNKGLNPNQKGKAIDKASHDSQYQALDADDSRIDGEADVLIDQLDKKLISQQDYNIKVDALEQQQTQNRIKRNDLDKESYSETQQAKQKALDEFMNMAQQAENTFAQIQQNKTNLQYQEVQTAIETNKRIGLSHANSAQEVAIIEAQANAQHQAAEIQKLQQDRKNKQEQITAEYALAVMKVVAANAEDFEIAGAIEIAGITGVYAANMALLSSTSYARGGDPMNQGGVFDGPSHSAGGIKYMLASGGNMRHVEVEGKEISIVNGNAAASNNVYTVTGTPKQIASGINTVGGGVNFAPGAKMSRFAYGGNLGSSLSAPRYVSSSSAEYSDLHEAIRQHHNMIMNNNNRMDNLKVYVLSKDIAQAGRKDQIRAQTGRL